MGDVQLFQAMPFKAAEFSRGYLEARYYVSVKVMFAHGGLFLVSSCCSEGWGQGHASVKDSMAYRVTSEEKQQENKDSHQ